MAGGKVGGKMKERISEKVIEGGVMLRLDMDNCGMEEFRKLVDMYGEYIRRHPHQSVLSLAVGGSGTPIFTDREWFVDFLTENKSYIKASAICGLDRVKQGMITAVISAAGRQIKIFDNEKEAEEWLKGQI